MAQAVHELGPEFDPDAFGWDTDTDSHVSDDSECVMKQCSVKVERLSAGTCVQLSSKTNIRVERLPRSALNPTFVFKAAQRNKSDMFPGKIFRGQRDWTKCSVPVDKPSVSSRLPGFVFNSTGKQKPHSSYVPPHLDVKLHVKPVSQAQVTVNVTPCAARHFSCLLCTDFVHKYKAAVK